MPTRSKLLLAATAATVVLSFAVSAAQARRLFFSASRYQAIWTLLKFEIPSQGAAIECPVTIEGSFHSASLTKVSGALIGYVTSAKIRGGRAECNNTGTGRANTESLPWHVRYFNFIGALPNITGITVQVIGGNFNIDPEGGLPNCRVVGTVANPGVGIVNVSGAGENRSANTIRADTTRTIPAGGEFFCEWSSVETDFAGTAELFVLGSTTTRVLVRLIQ